MDLCTRKLNNSSIPRQKNNSSLAKYSYWHSNITGGACSSISTPLSDEKSEGHFVNMNNGIEDKFLPWDKAEPNGGTDENFVMIRVSQRAYNDVPDKKQRCSSCLLQRSLTLRLDGLRENSFIGKVSMLQPLLYSLR